VGLQVIGPPGADGRVLALARAFQRETDWHLAVPRDAAGHGAGTT
jgi:Asp-tRNA(Asn)/Glu-tRNA(Gln) amidotransferase A subunit family amidase